MPGTQSQLTPAARHKRQTRRQILLPVLGGVVLIILLVGVVLWLPQRLQVGIVSDFMLSVFMLCPAVICMLPLTILMLSAAFGAGRLHDRAVSPLRGLRVRVDNVTGQIETAAGKINQRTVTYGARLGAVMRVLDVFEYSKPSAAHTDKESRHE
jgi:hypothetical protein